MGDGNGNFLMDKVQSGWDRKGMQTDLKEEFIIQACVEGHEPTTTIPPLTHVDLLSLADVSIIAEARVRKSRMKWTKGRFIWRWRRDIPLKSRVAAGELYKSNQIRNG